MRIFQDSCNKIRLLVLLSISCLSGCVRDRPFQLVKNPPPEVAFTVPVTAAKPYIEARAAGPENHATVEFKDHGRLADPCKPGHTAPCQLPFAVDFIHKARAMAKANQLVVLTFIHGNENNASIFSDNYPHFEQLINCLNLGDAAYKTQYATLLSANNPKKPRYLSCDGVPAPENVRYTGVYIGWRGKFFKGVINLQQNAAMRIGTKKEIVDALFTLRNAAKDNYTSTPARFIVVGHSFGGLMLEQASSQIFRAAYAAPSTQNANFGPCPDSKGSGFKPFTDLIVTINEAVDSVPSKKLIDFFQMPDKKYCHPDALAPAVQPPLIIALHSKSDEFTGRLGTDLRYIIPPRGGLFPGKFPKQDAEIPQAHSNWYMLTHSTPANLSYFQNLCYIDKTSFIKNEKTGEYTYQTGEDSCDYIADQTLITPRFDRAFPLAVEGEPLSHLYVRYDCKSTLSSDPHNGRSSCGVDDPSKQTSSGLHIWNRSPYWMMSVDDIVISGHNDFWNQTLISLLRGISGSWPTLPMDKVIEEPSQFLPLSKP